MTTTTAPTTLRPRARLVLLAAVLVIAACSGGSTNPASGPPGLSLVAGRIDALNGTGVAARFTAPQGIATDASGNVYVTEPSLHIVRKIASNGAVTTLAGVFGMAGYKDGPAAAALFSGPDAIAADADGNVFVADAGNRIIRRISAAGVVSTLAGTPGVHGLVDGPGTSAQFWYPQGMTIDRNGNLFVGDIDNAKQLAVVRRIDPRGVVSTQVLGPLGGTLSLAAGSNGSVYAGDAGQSGVAFPSVRMLAPDGTVTVLATFEDITSEAGMQSLNGIAVDAFGNVYVSNGQKEVQLMPNPRARAIFTGNTVVRISASGTVSTFAGTWGQTGASDGVGPAAAFNQPQGLAFDAQGNLFVADSGNNAVRKVTAAGDVTTIAGHASVLVDGTGAQAGFVNITGLATDQRGNVAIVEPLTVRRISAAGAVTTLWTEPPLSTSLLQGAAFDGAGNIYAAHADRTTYTASVIRVSPSGARSTFNTPGAYVYDLATSAPGDIYAIGFGSSTVTTEIDRVAADGVVQSTTVSSVRFLGPMAIDGSGKIYALVADTVVQIAGDGSATLLAGVSGTAGYADGPAATALFRSPQGIAVDMNNNVYVADTGNNVIRKISAAGTVSTVAGTFGSFDTVMGALPGGLYRPTLLAFDGDGSLLVVVNATAVVRVRLP